MGVFIKTCGAILLALILILFLGNKNKDLSMVLGLAVCAMAAIGAMEYLRPVLDFVGQLENLGGFDRGLIRILLKVSGIGLLSEIAALVCADSGCASLGRTVKIMAAAVILWLSLPLYAMLAELLQEILGGL